jgi:ribosomal protein S12 methylthiotransferase accessory factor
MMDAIAVRTPEYVHGTQRICDPEETLRRILPLARACGITRVLDITQLDRIGIPTYNAVRPNGIVLSISNGKGLTRAAASVSAIMESIEVEHSEYPLTRNWRLSVSARELERSGHRPIDPVRLVQDCLWPKDEYGGLYYSGDLVLDWVEGRELIGGGTVMLPASTVYMRPPFMHYFTSNGLASGNTTAEATLHALCEIIERDAIARLSGVSRSPLSRMELSTLPGHLTDLGELIADAGIELFLFSLPCAIDIYAFWAILYCPGEPAFILATSTGYGAHTDPGIAASRAVTEAAQARLAHIHGAREDLGIDHVNRQLPEAELAQRSALQARTFDKFRAMPGWAWNDFLRVHPHRAEGLDVPASLDLVLDMLKSAGLDKVFVHDLSKPHIGIPVVRAFVPGLKISAKML